MKKKTKKKTKKSVYIVATKVFNSTNFFEFKSKKNAIAFMNHVANKGFECAITKIS